MVPMSTRASLTQVSRYAHACWHQRAVSHRWPEQMLIFTLLGRVPLVFIIVQFHVIPVKQLSLCSGCVRSRKEIHFPSVLQPVLDSTDCACLLSAQLGSRYPSAPIVTRTWDTVARKESVTVQVIPLHPWLQGKQASLLGHVACALSVFCPIAVHRFAMCR